MRELFNGLKLFLKCYRNVFLSVFCLLVLFVLIAYYPQLSVILMFLITLYIFYILSVSFILKWKNIYLMTQPIDKLCNENIHTFYDYYNYCKKLCRVRVPFFGIVVFRIPVGIYKKEIIKRINYYSKNGYIGVDRLEFEDKLVSILLNEY